jgi:hypothetical protein
MALKPFRTLKGLECSKGPPQDPAVKGLKCLEGPGTLEGPYGPSGFAGALKGL